MATAVENAGQRRRRNAGTEDLQPTAIPVCVQHCDTRTRIEGNIRRATIIAHDFLDDVLVRWPRLVRARPASRPGGAALVDKVALAVTIDLRAARRNHVG